MVSVHKISANLSKNVRNANLGHISSPINKSSKLIGTLPHFDIPLGVSAAAFGVVLQLP